MVTADIIAELSRPFPKGSIHWRVGRSGFSNSGPWCMLLAYIDARDAMDRLDTVVGSENWQDSYSVVGGTTICTLSLKLNGEWISKSDGSGGTDVEAVKGGLSDAFKRACVKWGIARYLYGLKETWGECSGTQKAGWESAFDKKANKKFWWRVPEKVQQQLLALAGVTASRKPWLTRDHEKWGGVSKYMSGPDADIQTVANKFLMTTDIRNELEALKGKV